ncbi:hypothetical protein CPB85DRAFT_1567786, partial [Mucidula mucida]
EVTAVDGNRCFFLPPSSPISLWEPTVFGLSLPSLGINALLYIDLLLLRSYGTPASVTTHHLGNVSDVAGVVWDVVFATRPLSHLASCRWNS